MRPNPLIFRLQPVRDRIPIARFPSRNVSIVQSYSSTETSDVEEKKAFYDLFKPEKESQKKGDIVTVKEDLNAKVSR